MSYNSPGQQANAGSVAVFAHEHVAADALMLKPCFARDRRLVGMPRNERWSPVLRREIL